ncbi:MAG: signal peptidase I [Candidatus Eisenbacteria bacterium]
MNATRPERRPKSLLREYVEAIVYALLLTVALRAFVLQAFRIPSESMLDTLLVGDYLFVNKLDYGPKLPFTDTRLPGFRSPLRGDIIVFQYPDDTRRDYIKRCVALGGQTIEVKNKVLYIDGQKQVEPYVKHVDPTNHPAGIDSRDNYGPYQVPAGHLFMMGDNRDNSNDSRFWGPVNMNLVKGRAMFLYWSWDGERRWPRFHRILTAIR